MAEKPIVQGTENPGNSQAEGQTTQVIGTTATGATSQAVTQNTEKVEFSDPNMQKAWTEKTQRLAEERKSLKSEQESFAKNKSELERKAQIYDLLDQDEEVVNFILKKHGQQEASKITEEELIEAQQDPEKFDAVIKKRTNEITAPLFQKIQTLELGNAIQAYVDAAGNEDFRELYATGLIKPYILSVHKENPKLAGLELVRQAHIEARGVLNSVYARAEKLAQEKAAGIVQEKKNAITEKGGKTSISANKSYKGKTITEIGRELLAE